MMMDNVIEAILYDSKNGLLIQIIIKNRKWTSFYKMFRAVIKTISKYRIG